MSALSELYSFRVTLSMLRLSKSQLDAYTQRYSSRLASSSHSFIIHLQTVLDAMIRLLEKRPVDLDRVSVVSTDSFIRRLGIEEVNLFELLRFVASKRIVYKLNGFLDRVDGDGALSRSRATLDDSGSSAMNAAPALNGKGAPSVNVTAPLNGKGAPSMNVTAPLNGKGAPSMNAAAPLNGKGAPSMNAAAPLNGKGAPSMNAAAPLNGNVTPSTNATAASKNSNPINATTPDHRQSSHFPAVLDFIRSLTTDSRDSRVVVNYEREEPFVQLLLLNPAVYFHDVVSLCHSVIITGGTLQPVSFCESDDVV